MTGVLSIGEFARASGLTAKALRLYDELELLTPAEVNPANGYRYYAPEQVEQARLVARLRSAEVPLPRIAAIIGAATPAAAADEVLSYWRDVEAQTASAREVITSLVSLLRGQDTTMNESTLDVSLADLIARLHEELPDADDLVRITEARRRSQSLADLGDQLVDHYVSEAKLGGATWSQISDALGGTQPGRRSTHAFERFTDLNRHSIVLAQEVAATHRHEHIGSEHLLLGLLGEQRGVAHEVLVAQAVSEQQVRDAIEHALAPDGEQVRHGHIPFTAHSKEAIEQAVRASYDLGHDWVGTEHTLLGLVAVEHSVAAQVLRDLGFTADGLREQVTTALDARQPRGRRRGADASPTS